MARIPKGSLVQGQYKQICRDSAMYFSITVIFHKAQDYFMSTFVSICGSNHQTSPKGREEVHGVGPRDLQQIEKRGDRRDYLWAFPTSRQKGDSHL